jgi:hypothetical protein
MFITVSFLIAVIVAGAGYIANMHGPFTNSDPNRPSAIPPVRDFEFTMKQADDIQRYLESAAKVDAAVATGVNILRFSTMISELTGEFLVIKETWPDGIAIEQKDNLRAQLEAYHYALRLWQVRIDDGKEYAYIANYADETERQFRKDRLALFHEIMNSQFVSTVRIEEAKSSRDKERRTEPRIYVMTNTNLLMREASSLGGKARSELLILIKDNG